MRSITRGERGNRRAALLVSWLAVACGDDVGPAMDATGSTGEPMTTTGNEATSDPTTGEATSSTTDPSTTGSSGSTGSSSGCPYVDITNGLGFQAFDNAGLYTTIAVEPALGDPTVVERFRIEFYTDDNGDFDLAASPNDSYATCEQCVLLYEDVPNDPSAAIGRIYYQSSGTITVEDGPFSGLARVTTNDVVLVEVTIEAGTFESTPVENGACFELRNGTIDALVVENWSCETVGYANADGCQCGCGVADPDCPNAQGDSCDSCAPAGGCNLEGLGCPGIIDPAQNALCLDPLDVWTCADNLYDAGDSACDCGCALPDPDCDDGSAAACDDCNAVGSCGEGESGCLGVIHQANNSECTQYPGWTCNDGFYGADDGCDCGCGIVDADCTDGAGSSCEFCGLPGSCSNGIGLPCPGLVDPADNAVCLPVLDVWSCDDALHDAGDSQCDCGCGLIDPDCADDDNVAACDTCNEPGSCGQNDSVCVGVIALEPNAYCTAFPGWTCAESYHGDGMFCDCGCGIADPDCPDAAVASCDFCNNDGSCAADGNNCATIVPTDNAICQ